MAYVIASEGLHDQAYCDAHVLGFDEAHLPPGAPAGASYRSYLLGADRTALPKTPEWAAEITGIPAETIRRLAIEFATTKPAALQCGYAPGRTAFGEQFHRAAYALGAITGNVGIAGGSSGVSNGATGRTGIKSLPPAPTRSMRRVSAPLLADLLARGKAGGYPADIKLIYSAGGDLFNQAPNVNKMVGLAGGRGVHRRAGPFPDADRAPCRHRAAGDDVLGAQRRAHALGRRRPLRDLHAAGDPADVRVPQRHRHLRRPRGAASASHGYNDKTEEALAARADARCRRRLRRLRRQRRRPLRAPEDAVAFAAEIRDPEHHKFTTPSGKIEIYSMALAAKPDPYGLGRHSADPHLVRRRSTPAAHYPLKLCTPKSRARTHSIHGNQPMLGPRRPRRHLAASRRRARCAASPMATLVRVFNDRGATLLPAQRDRRASRRARCRSRKAPGSRRTRRRRHEGLRQRADRRPLGALRGDHLQHQPGRGRAHGAGRPEGGRSLTGRPC